MNKTEGEILEAGKEVEEEAKEEIENNLPKFLLMFAISAIVIILSFLFYDKLSQFKTLGLIGIFFINLISSATIFIPGPAIASVVAGGAAYGVLLVGIIAGLGAALGDMVGYLLGRSGKEFFIKKEKEKYKLIVDLFSKYGAIIIFIFAFIPNPLFDAIGILSGGLKYDAKKFFIIMLSARIARNLILAFLGAKI